MPAASDCRSVPSAHTGEHEIEDPTKGFFDQDG